MDPSYNLRQQKIYDDYNMLTDENLAEYLNNSEKYSSEVLSVIKDILAERNVIEKGASDIEVQTRLKQRHGCVTAWLIFMIVANSLASLVYLIAGVNIIVTVDRDVRPIIIGVLVLSSLLNVYFASLLLQWKKSGFVGIAIMSVLIFFVNLAIKMGPGRAILGLVGILILYGILQIEKDGVSAWDNMD